MTTMKSEFTFEAPNPIYPKQEEPEVEINLEAIKIFKQKRPRAWRLQHSKPTFKSNIVNTVAKPKLYQQTAFLELVDVELFSTYKNRFSLEVRRQKNLEKIYSTSLCITLECWQMKSHSHESSKSNFREYSSQYDYVDNVISNIIVKNERVSNDLDRISSSISAFAFYISQSSLTRRKIIHLSRRLSNKRSIQTSHSSTTLTFNILTTLSNARNFSSFLQLDRNDIFDLRRAFSRSKKSFQTSRSSTLELKAW